MGTEASGWCAMSYAFGAHDLDWLVLALAWIAAGALEIAARSGRGGAR